MLTLRVFRFLMLCFLFFLGACQDSFEVNAIPEEKTEGIVETIEALNLNVSSRNYQQLNEQLVFEYYWPSDEVIPADLNSQFKNVLPEIDSIFSQYFPQKRLQIIFTPDEQQTKTNYKILTKNQVQIFFNDLLDQNSLRQYLTSVLYLTLRGNNKLTEGGDVLVFEKMVAHGLSLHFIEQALSVDTLFQNHQLTQEQIFTFKETFMQTVEISDVLINQTLFEDNGIGWALGYYFVQQYLAYYQGSTAANSYLLPVQQFKQYFALTNEGVIKDHQYVRTGEVDDQIAVNELTRQANTFQGMVFLEGLQQQKMIALTFDDGPSDYTQAILQVLKQFDIKASFFWQGQNLARYQKEIEQAANDGHTIGNHSWNHPYGMILSNELLWQNQVEKMNQQSQQLLGVTPRFYRPPYGEITDEQIAYLQEKGMKVIQWSIDTRDWNSQTNSIENIQKSVINNQHREAIVLMHDAGGNRQNTVAALPFIIEYYQAQGYRFVNLETLLGISDKQ